MVQIPTGHALRVERQRGPAWYAKYRARADAVLNEYLDARVRSYIVPSALRRTRASLTGPTCELLEVR